MRQGRAILGFALLASLLAHVGLFALAARMPRPVLRPVLPIEIELVERPREAPQSPEPSVPAPTPTARARRKLPERIASEPGRAPAGPGTAAGRETVLRERPPVPDLSPRWPVPGGEAEGEGTAPLAPPPALDEGDRLAHRVREMLLEDAPFRRARESADPYWSKVKERLGRAFVVPAEVLEDRADGGFGPQTREAARAYLAQAKQFGETGNPERPEIYAPHAAAIPHIDQDLVRFQRSGLRRIEPGEDATRIATWVRVVFADDGTTEQVAIARPSGLPAHDRLALEAARSLPSLGPRPADQQTTIWAFETALWIVPPLPIAGCAFDATFVPGPCFYPLKRFVKSTVRLEALP